MGALKWQDGGVVYVDTQVVIYTVEAHPIYLPVMEPFWRAVQAGTVSAMSSELTVMEALTGPFKHGQTSLEQKFEQFFVAPGFRLIPLTQPILREAARLRATIAKLRTPDALHAATALTVGHDLFVTNDYGFRGIPESKVTILQDLVAAP
jgi:predicted nucleic acid-binding protein